MGQGHPCKGVGGVRQGVFQEDRPWRGQAGWLPPGQLAQKGSERSPAKQDTSFPQRNLPDMVLAQGRRGLLAGETTKNGAACPTLSLTPFPGSLPPGRPRAAQPRQPGPRPPVLPSSLCVGPGPTLARLSGSPPQVDDLKAKLAIQEAELKQKNENADKLIHVVGVETEKVSKEKAIADEEEAKVEVINKVRGRARSPTAPQARPSPRLGARSRPGQRLGASLPSTGPPLRGGLPRPRRRHLQELGGNAGSGPSPAPATVCTVARCRGPGAQEGLRSPPRAGVLGLRLAAPGVPRGAGVTGPQGPLACPGGLPPPPGPCRPLRPPAVHPHWCVNGEYPVTA